MKPAAADPAQPEPLPLADYLISRGWIHTGGDQAPRAMDRWFDPVPGDGDVNLSIRDAVRVQLGRDRLEEERVWAAAYAGALAAGDTGPSANDAADQALLRFRRRFRSPLDPTPLRDSSLRCPRCGQVPLASTANSLVCENCNQEWTAKDQLR